MKSLLAAISLTAVLTGVAHATKFDTSKMIVDQKGELAAQISGYETHCSADGVWPIIKELHNQLLSEVDLDAPYMDVARNGVKRSVDHEGKAGWCARTAISLQKLNDKLLTPKPPSVKVEQPPEPPEPPPPKHQPVDYSGSDLGHNAFLFVSLQRHATVCPMARPQAFEIARQKLMTHIGAKDLPGMGATLTDLMAWANRRFDSEVGAMVAAGMGGEWCRSMTATITTYQRMMFE